MNTPTATSARDKNAPPKLVSLLALAAGAAAMPQTSDADVIFQSANAHVGFGGGDSSSFFMTLPGTTVGFGKSARTSAQSSTGLFVVKHRYVVFGRAAGAAAYVQGSGGLAAPRGYGEAWNKSGLTSSAVLSAARATIHTFVGSTTGSAHHPNSGYDHQYLAFRFNNGGWRYGWVQVSLTVGPQPSMTIYGYAYDTTGAQLPIGVVPEPAPTAILALGALMLGAKGLRHWRLNRTTPSQS